MKNLVKKMVVVVEEREPQRSQRDPQRSQLTEEEEEEERRLVRNLRMLENIRREARSLMVNVRDLPKNLHLEENPDQEEENTK